MKILRSIAALLLVNTVVLWCIISMNLDSTTNYPSRGLTAWALINGFAALVTQLVSLIDSVEHDD